jgi:hypothetical protein
MQEKYQDKYIEVMDQLNKSSKCGLCNAESFSYKNLLCCSKDICDNCMLEIIRPEWRAAIDNYRCVLCNNETEKKFFGEVYALN